jgi:2,4-dienoyl-CoA reductase-like NADH-dependent reductase (Old Yellow Enzyme family)
MSKINEELMIKSVRFSNRLGMSPMCQYSAVDGFATDWHMVHYGSRAVGGVGLILLEATAVAPEGRITPYDLGLWNDEQIEGLKQITGFIHSQGSVAGIQIAHAGRKASHDSPVNGSAQLSAEQGGWATVAPSALPFDANEIPPLELDEKGISEVIAQFREAALRSLKAGFKVLEIHAAHGYLIHEFYSPLSNKRTDGYGGSFENRIRLLLEIVEAVQTVWPADLPLFVRLSATDWTLGGWTLDETVRLCEILRKKGVDLIDCSSGGNVATARIPVGPGYQVAFAEAVRNTGIMTSAVGLITTATQANSILQDGKADMVLLGRELLRQPYFALSADENITWPDQYLRAK